MKQFNPFMWIVCQLKGHNWFSDYEERAFYCMRCHKWEDFYYK